MDQKPLEELLQEAMDRAHERKLRAELEEQISPIRNMKVAGPGPADGPLVRTARLIIYEGPADWMERQRGRDLKSPYLITKADTGGLMSSIISVELDPDLIHFRETIGQIDMADIAIDAQIYEAKVR